MTIAQYIVGVGRYVIVGADPGECLNHLYREDIPIWTVEQQDDFTVSFTSYLKWEKAILTIGERAYCQGQCVKKTGLWVDAKMLLSRPCLVLSVLFALVLTFLLESLVWKIQIVVDDPLTEDRIRHVLQASGVDIWKRTDTIDPQLLRYALRQQIPELSWVAVNPCGGRVTVLALLKERDPEHRPYTAPCHLVAHRDGVITQSVVLEGMPMANIGDSVKAGQLLVSGYEDYGLYLKAVCAEGEIYGQTWHCGSLVTPSFRLVKHYTGRTWQETHILFGRKSINLSGSSSNLGVTCDKIIDTKQFSLPGHPFPLSLQRVTYREYTLTELPFYEEDARELLCRSWEQSLLSSMVAGRVEKTDYDCFQHGGYYIFNGESICHELLSRPMSPEPSKKGDDPIGTDH